MLPLLLLLRWKFKFDLIDTPFFIFERDWSGDDDKKVDGEMSGGLDLMLAGDIGVLGVADVSAFVVVVVVAI